MTTQVLTKKKFHTHRILIRWHIIVTKPSEYKQEELTDSEKLEKKTSIAKLLISKTNRRNFPNLTQTNFDWLSGSSSNQDPMDLNNEENYDDDEMNDYVDLKEIIQQIITL